ncbi:MAG: hypothetical protein NT133_19610 [Alphaproteobacteria bacterium]|nr:hypothetical protein [Alphaproteobacteria bacterium]
MLLPPAVTVHGIEHARMALRPGLPVTLVSGPGAALYAGAGWWRALIGAVLAETGREAPTLLDCADAPGMAMAALRIRLPGIILDGFCPAFASVASVAANIGAIVLPHRPHSLDLAQPGAAYRLAEWLQRDIVPPLR